MLTLPLPLAGFFWYPNLFANKVSKQESFMTEPGQHIFDLPVAKVYYVCAGWAIPQKQKLVCTYV